MALSDVIYNFQSDPDKGKKIIFVVVWALILGVIGFGIWAINQPPSSNTQTLSTPTDLSDITKQFDFPTKFPESATLKPVTDKQVLNDRTFIATNSGEPVFVSNELQFVIGTQLVNNFPIAAPLSIYPIKLGYIINDYQSGLLLLKDETGFIIKPNPTEINQVIPLNTGVDEFGFTSQEEYYYLLQNENGYSLNKSKSIQLDNPQKLADLESEMASSGFYQLFRSRNTIVIGLFDNPSQQGRAQYWIYKNNKLTQSLNIENNWSVNVSENFLIITKNELYSDLVSNYINDIYDLSGDVPKLLDINTPFILRQNEIFGNVLARRCTASSIGEIYCLVKEKPVKVDDENEPDLVVKINTFKKTVSILASNKNVAPSSGIYGDWARNRLLLSNQKDRLIYELPSEESDTLN